MTSKIIPQYILLLTMAVFLTSCIISPVGGTCEFNDETKLAIIKSNYNEKVVLKPVFGQDIVLTSSEFQQYAGLKTNESAQTSHYYEIKIRHYISGGCNPFNIQSIEKLEAPKTILTPSAPFIYAASFLLDSSRNCTSDNPPKTCIENLHLSPDMNKSQRAKLVNIKPRSLNTCAVNIMQNIWPDINRMADMNKTNILYVTCAKTVKHNEVAIIFSTPEDKPEEIFLRKIY